MNIDFLIGKRKWILPSSNSCLENGYWCSPRSIWHGCCPVGELDGYVSFPVDQWSYGNTPYPYHGAPQRHGLSIFSVCYSFHAETLSLQAAGFKKKKNFSFGLRKSFFALLGALPLIVERAFVCLRLVMWKAIRMAARSSADMFLKATAHNKKSVVGSLFLFYRLQDFLWMIGEKTPSHTSCLCMLLRWFHRLLIPSPGAIQWVLGNRTKQHERRWLSPWIPKWIKWCLVKERQCLSQKIFTVSQLRTGPSSHNV